MTERSSGEKAFHIFISYRVFSDALLAERLCDKLQQMGVGRENVTVRCFLDKQNLKDGEDWEEGFRDGLRRSMMFMPLISEAAIKPISELPEGKQDNVLLEYELALAMRAAGDVEVLPLLVGSITDENHYKPFKGFGMPWPNRPSATNADCTVRDTMQAMFKLQGIRINPNDVVPKLASIRDRLARYAWPRFRGDWYKVADLGAPERFTCVQCKSEFDETTNGPGHCEYEAQSPWGRAAVDKRRGRHRKAHHNEYQYKEYFTWAIETVGWKSKAEEWVDLKVYDYELQTDISVGRVGIVRDGSNAGKLFVAVRNIAYILILDSEELAEIENMGSETITRLPAASDLPEGVDAWVEAKWVFNEGVLSGISLRCQPAFTENIAETVVSFTCKDLQLQGCDVISSVEILEHPLPPDTTVADAYNIPRVVATSGTFLPEDMSQGAQGKFPTEGDVPVRCKVGLVECNQRSRSDADMFHIPIALINLDEDKKVTVLEVKARWKLRTEEETAWRPVENSATFGIIEAHQGSIPFMIPAGEISNLEFTCCIPCDIKGRWFNRSWLARFAPVQIELAMEDKFGKILVQKVEFCQPAHLMEHPKPNRDARIFLFADNVATFDRHVLSITEPQDGRDSDPLFKVSVPGQSYDVSVNTLRSAVYKATKSEVSEIECFSNLESADFRFSLTYLIDVPAARVYAIRTVVRSSWGCTAVAYYILPSYGAMESSEPKEATPATETTSVEALLQPDLPFQGPAEEPVEIAPGNALQVVQQPAMVAMTAPGSQRTIIQQRDPSGDVVGAPSALPAAIAAAISESEKRMTAGLEEIKSLLAHGST